MSTLKQVRPHIWHIEMEDPYELAMTFLRASETYESANSDFRGKYGWTIFDHMKWYSTSDESGRSGKYGSFSFPADWGGYNVPSHIFERLYPFERIYPFNPDFLNTNIADWNEYDERMFNFLRDIRRVEDGIYYVVGTQRGDRKGTFGHELAHGYYYTNEEYRNAMYEIMCDDRHVVAVNRLKAEISDLGYCEAVLFDEVQAYCSTGFPEAFANLIHVKKVQRLVHDIGQVFAREEKKHNG